MVSNAILPGRSYSWGVRLHDEACLVKHRSDARTITKAIIHPGAQKRKAHRVFLTEQDIRRDMCAE